MPGELNRAGEVALVVVLMELRKSLDWQIP
jgi:hypothetical protein